jgi:YidC/Oxa1 family membrane protein insertase
MDRRTLLTISICFLIYLGWQKFYLEPRLPHPQAVSQTVGTTGSTSATTTSSTANTAEISSGTATPVTNTKKPTQTLSLQTGTGEAVAGDGSAVFSDWKLKSYRVGLAPEAAAVDMHTVTHESGEMLLAFDNPSLGYLANIQGTITKTDTGAEWHYEDNNVKLSRILKASTSDNAVDVVLNAEFKTAKAGFAFVSVNLPIFQDDPEERDRQFVYWTNDSLERVTPKKAELKQIISPVKYIGVTSRYFLMALVNQSPVEPKGLLQGQEAGNPKISFQYPINGNSISIPLRVYFGPKDLDLIRSVDPTLDHTVDFGWFTIIAYPILKFLKFIYEFVRNYGVAIILLTIALKIVTYPLTYKSMKNMKEMAKLQPLLAKVREKYKDDKEALNRETLSLMKTHGANPMAGCLPMLIQMPVFFALYRVLYSSIELYHAPFFGYIHDLSAPDPFYVTPGLMSVLMFGQQKLTPNTATDPAQQKMIQFMPLIFGVFMLKLPAGLTLYMLTNAAASIVQQLILNKKLGITRNVPATTTAIRAN